MKPIKIVAAVGLGLALAAGVPAQETGAQPAPLLLILDASGSMWGQIEGENKIVIARRVLKNLVDGLDEGLRATILAKSEGNPFCVEEIINTGRGGM